MATSTDNLSWRNVDTNELAPGPLDRYEVYKALQRQAAQAREAFEAEFSTSMGLTPTSPQRLVFGYKFGKLSIAVAPNDKPKAVPKRTTSTPADYPVSVLMTGARV